MDLKCFHCGYWFESGEEMVCTTCEWHNCPNCHKCKCDLSPEAQVVAETMQEQYKREITKIAIKAVISKPR